MPMSFVIFWHLLFKQLVCSLEKMWSLLGIDHKHIYFWSLYCLNCKCFLYSSTMNIVRNSAVQSKIQDINLAQPFLLMLSSNLYESFVSFFSGLMQSVVCAVARPHKGRFSWLLSFFSLVWGVTTKWGRHCSDVGGKILWCKCCL